MGVSTEAQLLTRMPWKMAERVLLQHNCSGIETADVTKTEILHTSGALAWVIGTEAPRVPAKCFAVQLQTKDCGQRISMS